MGKLAGFKKGLLATALAVGVMATSQANAQMATLYDNNVMVDLSVLNDNGVGARPAAPSAYPSYGTTSGAQLPPKAMPKSKFFGLPQGLKPATPASSGASQLKLPSPDTQSRIVLRKPSMPQPAKSASAIQLKKPAAPKPMAKKEVAKTVAAPKTMVKAEPKPVVMAKPAPKPVPAPAPVKEIVKAEPPKPKAAPVKPVEMAKPAPVPAPAPKKEMVAEAPAEKPAPAPKEVMAAAPPPPPPSAVEPKAVESAMKETAKKATVTAALPSASESSVRVPFGAGESKMPASAQGNLKDLAEALRSRPDDRIQLMAYAGGENLSASKARRLSLSRALAVRSYLIDAGIQSTRIDVRALGNKTTEEPFDRVDVQIAPR